MGAADASHGGCAVSAIMPAFNSRAFIGRAIDSILSQQGPHRVELIVVDDCSVDGTADFIRRRYGADERLRLLSTDRNRGPGAARNLAIDAAAGEWIALIDADDCWTSDRLQRLFPICREGVDLVFDNLLAYDHAHASVGAAIFPSMPAELTVPLMAAERAPGTIFNYGYLKPIIRKSFLEATGVRYSEIRISEDLLFYLELLIHHPKTRILDQACYVYTTSIGPVSGVRSTLSTSAPDDLLVASMIDELMVRRADLLAPEDVEALRRRSDALRQSAPLTRLYDSWTRRDYLTFASQFLSDSKARRELFRKVVKRLRLSTR